MPQRRSAERVRNVCLHFAVCRCRVCGFGDGSGKGQTRNGLGVDLAQPHGLGGHTDVKRLHAHVDVNPGLPQTAFIVFAPKSVPLRRSFSQPAAQPSTPSGAGPP